MEDIRKVYDLFVDVKRSTEFLQSYQADFMFSESQAKTNSDAMQE